MTLTVNQDPGALTKHIKTSLQKAEKIVSSQRKVNTGLLITGMTSSAASTLVAGFTAVSGPVIGVGTEGWRLACIIAAALGFTATISTGLGQQLKTNDRLTEGTQCIGRLKSLDVGVMTGSRSWEDIANEYEEIVKTYPEIIS